MQHHLFLNVLLFSHPCHANFDFNSVISVIDVRSFLLNQTTRYLKLLLCQFLQVFLYLYNIINSCNSLTVFNM